MKRKYRKYIFDEENSEIPRSTLTRWAVNPRISAHPSNPGVYDNPVDVIEKDETDDESSNSSDRESLYSDTKASSSESTSVREDNFSDAYEEFEFEEKLDDWWLTAPIYETSEITVGEAVEYILEFYFRNSLTKKSLDELLSLLSSLLPRPNNIPRTKYLLSQRLNSIVPLRTTVIRKHRFCDTCSYYLGDWTKNITVCDACQSTEVNGMFVEYDLKSRLVDAFEIRNLDKLIDEYRETVNAANNDTCVRDISGGSAFKKLKQQVITGDYDLCLLWNTDGMPTANSSNGQMWAIQVEILNVPPTKRRAFQFVCGLYYSCTSKPDMNSFLYPFTMTMKDLYTNGVEWHHRESGLIITSKVIAPIATLDCPARAAAQNLMQFNGTNGCSFCEHPGETCRTGAGINHVYPPLRENPPLRTNERMHNQALEAIETNSPNVGVKGPSVLWNMPCFDMAIGFVPDYMHATLLGVGRMLLNCWCDTKNKDQPFYLKKSSRDEIDQNLLQIKPPDSITRTPRALKYRHFWKASEVRAFLLFYAPILLKSLLPVRYYQHLLLLIAATRILLQLNIPCIEIDLAEHLLYLFVLDIGNLYGHEKYSFNVHQLTHMAHFVRLWGPLWAWSAFPFEDGNGYLLKIAHGPNKLDVEIFNTLHFIDALNILKNKIPLTIRKIDTIRPLGSPIQKCLDDTETSAVRNVLRLLEIELSEKSTVVYARVEIGGNVFTSELYRRQTKRENYSVFWENRSELGCIKCFVSIDSCLLVIIQKLAIKTDKKDYIIHNSTKMNFEPWIKPIRRTYCIDALPVEKIEGKFLKIRTATCDYACMFPNDVERK